MQISIDDMRMLAQECELQKSGEMSVFNLAFGYYYLQLHKPDYIDIALIKELGRIVEPEVNARGFRSVPVFIGGRMAGVNHQLIEPSLNQICEAYNENRMISAELYQEFETCHPFSDGNGRVGFLLYNKERIISGSPLHMPPMYVSR